MSKKVWILLLSLICVIGGSLSIFLYINTDRKGPEILLSSERITYRADDDTSVLLEGVTAIDDVDGDVSDSLIVEAIYPSADGKKAKIIYAAMDSSNNVTKKQRIVDYESAEESIANPETEIKDDENISDEQELSKEKNVISGNGDLFSETEIEAEEKYLDADIVIVNGSGVSGVAGKWQSYLEQIGYTAISTGSYKANPSGTGIYTDNQELAEILLQYFPSASVEERMPVEDVDISLDSAEACVVVGPQYQEVPVNDL